MAHAPASHGGTRGERRLLAGGADLSAGLALALAQDPDRQVREVLAANLSTPDDALLLLLSDRVFHVRWNAAQNPAAGDRVRRRALELDGDVPQAIGQLVPDLSDDLVELVLTHPDPAVRVRAAEATRDHHYRLAPDKAVPVRVAVAAQTDDPTLLAELATDKIAKVRQAAAQNLRCPREVVLALARDRSVDVRWSVMAFRLGDREVSALLDDDPDDTVRQAAAGPRRRPEPVRQATSRDRSTSARTQAATDE